MKAQLIVALDVATFAEAKKIVDGLKGAVPWFKVGSQLFTAAGPRVIQYIDRRGGRVFLDLKFHDIPNTVACAVRAAVGNKVAMLTLHASGGRAMLEAAVDAARDEAKRLKVKRPVLVGVTVLTSQEAAPGEVLARAQEAVAAGCDGVVCSVREADLVRRKISKRMVIVTPAIRSGQGAVHDQKRTATAAEAVRAGSDFLVVGRPIVAAADPVKAAREILKEMKGA